MKNITLKSVQQANPAAGADFSIAVPAGKAWRIKLLHAQLNTSATVATRTVLVQIKDPGGNVVLLLAAPGGQAASLTGHYNIVAGGQQGQVGQVQAITMPSNLRLGPGWTISTSTSSIQAADQWSAINMAVEEVLVGPDGFVEGV